MTERTKTGLEIIQASLFIGVLGNILLREGPWGINAFLFVAMFVTALIMLWRRHKPRLLNRTNAALAAAMVFFSSMFLVRDAEELLVFDTFAIIILMGILLLASFDVKAHIAGTFHYIAGVIGAGLNSVFGGFLLLGADIEWGSMPTGRLARNIFAVLRGLAIALPLLLIFGGLFAAADAVFEGWVNRALNFDVDVVVSHVVISSALAWLTAGYFRAAVFGRDIKLRNAGAAAASGEATPGGQTTAGSANAEAGGTASDPSFVAKVAAEQSENANVLPNNATVLEHINISDPPDPEAAGAAGPSGPQPEQPAGKRDWQNLDSSRLPAVFTLGTVETVLILGLLDLLFLGFVIAQVPYLFGGMEFVQSMPDLKLAEFARRGFGELVFASALVLPLLLLSHWLVRRDGSRAEAVFRVLAGVQIALLFIIMASAAQRLSLLTGEFGYGLTTVRFYPMVFMIWLAVVFAWFAATVLVRGTRSRFAWGALWAAVLILGGTNLLNPHDYIARTNIALMQQGREFDAYYNSSELSDDAVPALIAALPHMSLEDRCVVGSSIHYRYRQLGQITDLRSLNLSRRAAFSQLRANDALLHQTEGCPPQYHNDVTAEKTDIGH